MSQEYEAQVATRVEGGKVDVSSNSGSGSNVNDDHLVLKKMGYDQTLHRGLGLVSNFAFGFTEVAILVSICVTLSTALSNGGPANMLWSFFVHFMITILVGLSMAEICSAYPSAGSVYHWAGQLVPEEWAPLCSYLTGWTNWIGNTAGDASFAYGFAQFLSSGLMANGHKAITQRELVGTAISVLFIWTLMNFFRIDKVGWVNTLAAVTHTCSIIIICIALLAIPSRLESGDWVFTSAGYSNQSGFDDQFQGTTAHSYVCASGISAALFAFVGYEASAHMSEETENAEIEAPRGIMGTVLATGIGGLFLIISILFSTSSVETALYGMHEGTGMNYGTAVANIMMDSTMNAGWYWGPALIWLVVINAFFAGMSSVAVTGRITYALARDNGFPLSSVIATVNPTFKSPFYALLFVWFIDSLLLLLPLDDKKVDIYNDDKIPYPTPGGVAFTSITNLCSLGFQISYALPIFFKVMFPQPNWPTPKFNLGIYSIPINIIAFTWLFATSCLLFIPGNGPISNENAAIMNWLIVVVAGFFLLGMINWIFNSRFHFSGPPRVSKYAGDKTFEMVVSDEA